MSALRVQNPQRQSPEKSGTASGGGERSPAEHGTTHPSETLVGQSSVMRAMYERIASVAPTGTSVLITGEVGTERELVARSIHANSPWRANPFVSVRVAELESDLLANALFGTVHESSGESDQPNDGLLAAADGGTLFLDELIGIPLLAQAELLRAINRCEIIPVGGTTARQVNVRLIAATTSNPTEAIQAGRLRRDLLERLAVCLISIPPLRGRIEDIPALAVHFLRILGVENPAGMLPANTLAFLQSRPWLENVRELRAALHHALLNARDRPLQPAHFPSPLADRQSISRLLQSLVVEWVRSRTAEPDIEPSNLYRDLQDIVARALLTEVLRQNNGQILPTARWLGLTRPTVRKMVRKFRSAVREPGD